MKQKEGVVSPCPDCGGTKTVCMRDDGIEDPCPSCNGTGKVSPKAEDDLIKTIEGEHNEIVGFITKYYDIYSDEIGGLDAEAKEEFIDELAKAIRWNFINPKRVRSLIQKLEDEVDKSNRADEGIVLSAYRFCFHLFSKY
jgi:hypothetical protein